ncbi:RNA polymerase [Xylariaceae sp. FL0804]|nr:RNA polymerase [Xylariaceae sp. FL0804]
MADLAELNAEANEKTMVRTWRAWRTAHEMVQDRGYELAETEVKISLDSFKAQFTSVDGSLAWDKLNSREKLKFSARPSQDMMKKYTPPATAANPDPQPDVGTIWVEFFAGDALGADQMRKFAKFCSHEHYKTGLLVTHVPVSAGAKKEIARFAQWTTIEWFLEEDLLINITHHELVPRHVILSREEKIALLKRYRLKETQLPRILQRDQVAKYFGMRRGQVVKIIRSSETAGRYASYRLCV